MTKNWFHKTIIYLLILLFGSNTFAINLKQTVTSKTSEIHQFNHYSHFNKKASNQIQIASNQLEELIILFEDLDLDEDDELGVGCSFNSLFSELDYFRNEKCFGFRSFYCTSHFTKEISVRFPKTHVVNCVYII